MMLEVIKKPTGDYLEIDGKPPPNPAKPISVELDRRKYILPAVFYSGDCMVRITVRRLTKYDPDQPINPNDFREFMHCNHWPLIKASAKEIAQRCVVGVRDKGHFWGKTLMSGHKIMADVRIIFKKKGGMVNKLFPATPSYHVTRCQKKAGRIRYDLDLEQLPPSNRIFYRVMIRVEDTLYTTLALLQVVDLK